MRSLLQSAFLLVLMLTTGLLYSQVSNNYEVNKVLKQNVDQFWGAADEYYGIDQKEYLRNVDFLYQYLTEKSNEYNGASQAFIFHTAGICKQEAGDLPSAIAYYQKAVDLRVEIGHPSFHKAIGNAYDNISNCYYKQKQFFKAKDAAEKGHIYLIENVSRDTLVRVWAKLAHSQAKSYSIVGDIDNAVSFYETAISYGRFGPDKNVRGPVSKSLQELGFIYNQILNKDTEATIFFDEAIEISDPENDYCFIGTVLHDQASLEMKKGCFEAAIKLANESIEVLKLCYDTAGVASNYNNLSIIYKRMSIRGNRRTNLELAEKYILKARDWLMEDDFLYDNWGDIKVLQKNYPGAIQDYTRAIKAIIPDGLEETDLDTTLINDKNGLLTTVYSLARVYALQGDYRKSLETFKKAKVLIGSIRRDYQPDASKGLLSKKAKPIFGEAIKLCWRLYMENRDPVYAEEALLFSEASKSLILNDAVGHVRATTATGDSSLIAREKRLSLEVTYWEKELATLQINTAATSRDSLIINARREMLDARKALSLFQDEIETDYPRYAQYLEENTVRSFADIQALLLDEYEYLEYFVADSAVFAFRLNGQQPLDFYKLDDVTLDLGTGHTDLRAAIESVRRAMKAYGDSTFFRPGYALYEALVAPVISDTKDQLVIIPDGILYNIAFDMLPSRMPEDMNTVKYSVFDEYLMFKKTISYQHSLVLGKRNYNSFGSGLASFLGIAPVFSQADKVPFSDLPFQPLNNQTLSSELTSYYGAGSVKYIDISPDELRGIIGKYRIVQFDSHAFANNDNGDFSYVLIKDGKEWKQVFTKDIYAMRMPGTELVILNVCSGGTGDLQEGEGFISLSRSFFYAGAQSVIAALWTVDDDATTKIAQLFHEELQNGKTKDIALNSARRRYIKSLDIKKDRFAHPYYWAALLPVGNMDAIEGLQSKAIPAYIWWALGALLVGVFVFFGNRFLRKKRAEIKKK